MRNLWQRVKFTDLQSSIRPEVLEDLRNTHDYWKALHSPTLDEIQSKVYDMFLKSNDVEAELHNDTLVVGLLINIVMNNFLWHA